MSDILSSATAVGMVLENDTGTFTWGGGDLDAYATGLGGLHDDTDQTLFQILLPTSVTVDDVSPIREEFQDLSDVYVKRRYVRDNGGITFTFPADYDSGGGVTDAGVLQFLRAGKYFWSGVTGTTLALSDPVYNPLDDTDAGSETNDLAGWAVEILCGDSANNFKWVLHNCVDIEVTAQEIAFQKALQITVKVADARIVEGPIFVGGALTTHTDA